MKVTYIHHSSFLVEMEHLYLLFDYTEGRLPALEEDKDLLVFVSHRHGDHYSKVIFELKQDHGRTRYILSDDIWRKRLPPEVLDDTVSMKWGQRLTLSAGGGEVGITTLRSTDEGVAFLVNCGGKLLYHAGDLNNWQWDEETDAWNKSMAAKYTKQVEQIAGMRIYAAFLPLDPRQEEDFYLGMDEFLTKVSVEHVFPMHCWGDFSVIDRIRRMPCAAAYRDRIAEIQRDGDVFEI